MPTKENKIAVVLLQFGGPDSLEAVEPFLYNLFNDPDIFELPLSGTMLGDWFRKRLARYISKNRSPEVKHKYDEIGGKSPIVDRTDAQLRALQAWFDSNYPDKKIDVRLAMRYWTPLTEETQKSLTADGYSKLVLLPLYAQYSKTNAGSSFNEWDRVAKQLGTRFQDRRIREYYNNEKYLAALNARMDEALAEFEDPTKVTILFSAHGIPEDIIKRGDPYAEQVKLTIDELLKRRPTPLPSTLSFQSKVGPKKWLTPNTTDTIERLGKEGVHDLLVVPIAFVSDHIETLHELEIEERENAEKFGIEHFVVMKGLNDHPLFIEALGEMAMKEIEQLKHH